MIIQRHVKGYGAGNYLNWQNYKDGYGNPEGNYFWTGLDRIHELTTSGLYYLEIILKKSGQTKTVKYTSFSVASESNRYRMTASGFDPGTSGLSDGLSYYSGMYFSTPDRDNDNYGGNCASNKYGWWFNRCGHGLTHYSSNGPYFSGWCDESTMILKLK